MPYLFDSSNYVNVRIAINEATGKYAKLIKVDSEYSICIDDFKPSLDNILNFSEAKSVRCLVMTDFEFESSINNFDFKWWPYHIQEVKNNPWYRRSLIIPWECRIKETEENMIMFFQKYFNGMI